LLSGGTSGLWRSGFWVIGFYMVIAMGIVVVSPGPAVW
jgi:hypothetical protein